jgi:DNA-binding XRE family transcriptional regulator
VKKVKGYKNFKLKGAIAEKGVTQEEVAQAIGITPATISKKINGKLSFDEHEMQSIADFLGREICDIFFTSQVTNRITKAV